MTRRALLAASLATSVSSAAPQRSAHFTKSICSIIFPENMPLSECFTRAKAAGFDAMELSIGRDIALDISRDEAKRIGDAAHKAGIRIATIWLAGPLHATPLNASDPAVRARGIDAIRKAITIATGLHCEAILLYAVRLGSGPKLEYGSQETWDRFSAALREVIPMAAQAKVRLNPENVWNKFLLSPLEMRAFVDQFHSPWLQTHFDVGNVMQYGYPEDWILTLGSRIQRVHFKDYKLTNRGVAGQFVDLLQGDVNWKGVMDALVKVRYNGFLSPEIDHDPAQPDQLKVVSASLDKILSMS
ncbi:MAG TPA: sugar phosphate isomerase/epimerase family protein [Bryobacteraceae bacterium]|jgi:hexulose-6-phosphate isomerase|nr:sugar phosphate isomerase/epimerase family protein [Bryobacteraceae bacterium]